MTRSEAINLSSRALKAAHLTPDPNACAVLALALLGAAQPEGQVLAVVDRHLAAAVADLKATFPTNHPALAVALLAAPKIAADLAPVEVAKPEPKPTKPRAKPPSI